MATATKLYGEVHDASEALRHEVAALRTRVEQLESTVSQLQSLLT